jgi:hypothetical protein
MEGYQIDTFSDALQNARQIMLESADSIPFEFVRRVRLQGNIEAFTALEGHNLASPEGQEQLQHNAAMYLLCVDVCLMGAGHLLYQLFLHGNGPAFMNLGSNGAEGMEEGNVAAAELDEKNEVEIIGEVHPEYGYWDEDNNHYESDDDFGEDEKFDDPYDEEEGEEEDESGSESGDDNPEVGGFLPAAGEWVMGNLPAHANFVANHGDDGDSDSAEED